MESVNNGARRRAIISIDQDFLIAILRGEYEIEGWPADARVIGVNANWERHGIDVLVESETFDVVPTGMNPPRLGSWERFCTFKVVQVASPPNRHSCYAVPEGTEQIDLPGGRVKFREFL